MSKQMAEKFEFSRPLNGLDRNSFAYLLWGEGVIWLHEIRIWPGPQTEHSIDLVARISSLVFAEICDSAEYAVWPGSISTDELQSTWAFECVS